MRKYLFLLFYILRHTMLPFLCYCYLYKYFSLQRIGGGFKISRVSFSLKSSDRLRKDKRSSNLFMAKPFLFYISRSKLHSSKNKHQEPRGFLWGGQIWTVIDLHFFHNQKWFKVENKLQITMAIGKNIQENENKNKVSFLYVLFVMRRRK